MFALLNYLEKEAEINTQLLPHQARVIDKLQKRPGLVAYHGVGSGKSLASLGAQDSLKMPSTVVVPASLKTNYEKEQKKHITNPFKTEIVGLENAARKGSIPKNDLLVVDEAHRLRDSGTASAQVIRNHEAQKRLLLTGSLMYNHPSDMASPINIAAGDNILPTNKAEFEHKYVFDKQVNPGFINRMRGIQPGIMQTVNTKERKNLQKILSDWVDYEPSSKDEFPSVERQDIRVPMSEDQQAVYDTILGKAPKWVAAKIRAGLPPSKAESKDLNSYLTASRQISNTTAPFITNRKASAPKIQAAFDELKKHLDANPQAKAAIYSNYLSAGIDPYRDMLQESGIPFGSFTGKMTRKDRDQTIQDYNKGKIRALLLSSAGGEGLDLQNTSLFQALEPHFNEEKIRQAEGRAIRFRSHASLPPEQRKVLVQRFLATRRPNTLLQRTGLEEPGGAVDEYLADMGKNKQRLNDEFKKLLIENREKELQQQPTS